MNPLYQAGLEVQTFLQNRKWPFCFIGGIAVLRWGQVRMTQDIDLSVFTGFGSEMPFISALLDGFASLRRMRRPSPWRIVYYCCLPTIARL